MSVSGDEDAVSQEIDRGLRRLEHAIDGIPSELARIREHMAVAKRGRNDLGYRLTLKVHALLVRLGTEVHARTRLALDHAERLAHLGTAATTQPAPLLRRRAFALREALAASRDTLFLILEEERRKESARLAAHQRALGLAVAALAGVTAMPLLVGELDGEQLTAALTALPGVLGTLGPAFEASRPWLALMAAVGAIGVLILLSIVLLQVVSPPKEPGTDPVTVVGISLMPLKRLAEEAERRGATASEQERQSWDQAACDAVINALERLEETDRRAAKGDIDEAIDAFVIRTEIGARLPPRLPFPRAVALLRCLDPNDPDAWIDAAEVPGELDRVVRGASMMPARELADRLLKTEL